MTATCDTHVCWPCEEVNMDASSERPQPSQTRIGAGFVRIHPQPELQELFPLYEPRLFHSTSRQHLDQKHSTEMNHLTYSNSISNHSWLSSDLDQQSPESTVSDDLNENEYSEGTVSEEAMSLISENNLSPPAKNAPWLFPRKCDGSLMLISSHNTSLYGPCRYDCTVDCNQFNTNWNNSNALCLDRNAKCDAPDTDLNEKLLKSKQLGMEVSSTDSYSNCTDLSTQASQGFKCSQRIPREDLQQTNLELHPMPNLPVLPDINFITDTRKQHREQGGDSTRIIIKVPKTKCRLSALLSSNEYEAQQFRRRKTGTYIILKRKAKDIGDCRQFLMYFIYPFWAVYLCVRICVAYGRQRMNRRKH